MKTLLTLYTRIVWVLEHFVAPIFWLLVRCWLAYSILQMNPGKLLLVLAALLVLGLAGRVTALMLLYCIVFNTLSLGGAEQLLLLGIVLQGPGVLSMDALLRRKVRRNILDIGPLTRAMKRSHKRF